MLLHLGLGREELRGRDAGRTGRRVLPVPAGMALLGLIEEERLDERKVRPLHRWLFVPERRHDDPVVERHHPVTEAEGLAGDPSPTRVIRQQALHAPLVSDDEGCDGVELLLELLDFGARGWGRLGDSHRCFAGLRERRRGGSETPRDRKARWAHVLGLDFGEAVSVKPPRPGP